MVASDPLNEHGSQTYADSARRQQRTRAMTLGYSIDTSDPRTESFEPGTDCFRWDGAEIARAFDHFQDPNHSSQRQYAHEHGIPRSTLGDWLRKDFPDHLDPEL